MKNGPARERGFHRSKSSYGERNKTPYRYPEWCSSGAVPQWIRQELETARNLASRKFTPEQIAAYIARALETEQAA